MMFWIGFVTGGVVVPVLGFVGFCILLGYRGET